MFEISKYVKEFDKVLDGAVKANEAQVFSDFHEKLTKLQEIVINLTEAKEEELCKEKVASIKEKYILTKEIKTRCDVAEAKVRFYKKFHEKLKAMKKAYDKMEKD